MWNIFIPGIRQTFDDISNLRLDLNPDSLADGYVSSWANAGAAGGTFTAAGSAQPLCVSNALNGHKIVDADGIANIMDTTLIGSNILSVSAYTIFAVVNIDAVETNTAQPADDDAIMSVGNEFQGLHLTESPRQFLGYHFDGVQKADTVSTTFGSYILLQVRYDGTRIYARSGATAEGAGTLAGNVTSLANTVRLFRNYTIRFFDGKLARLLTFDANLNTNDIRTARARLAALYGVAV